MQLSFCSVILHQISVTNVPGRIAALLNRCHFTVFLDTIPFPVPACSNFYRGRAWNQIGGRIWRCGYVLFYPYLGSGCYGRKVICYGLFFHWFSFISRILRFSFRTGLFICFLSVFHWWLGCLIRLFYFCCICCFLWPGLHLLRPFLAVLCCVTGRFRFMFLCVLMLLKSRLLFIPFILRYIFLSGNWITGLIPFIWHSRLNNICNLLRFWQLRHILHLSNRNCPIARVIAGNGTLSFWLRRWKFNNFNGDIIIVQVMKDISGSGVCFPDCVNTLQVNIGIPCLIPVLLH